MSPLEINIVETIVTVLIFLTARYIVSESIERTVVENLLQRTRGKIVRKIINTVLLLIAMTFLVTIWGIESSQITLFLSSVLAVVGVAMFAQWSILSNITAGLILFFNHSVKLDDHITVLDKEFNVEGRVSDIGLFFVIIKTDDGEQITLPSNIFMQKMVRKKGE